MRVAIVGASSHRQKYGNKALRSYVANGHEVYPVNPNEAEVEGLKTYPSVKDILDPIDRVLLYVPPEVGIKVLDDIAEKGAGEIYVNPGAGDASLIRRGEQLRLNLIQDCAIVAIGDSPARYP